MKLLLDTHLLLWAALSPARLSNTAKALLTDEDNQLFFSPVSLWEVSIKNSLGRPDFNIDPRRLRRGFMDNGYSELPITSEHALMTAGLPPLHKDPFDRMLVAQAKVEGILLLTSDTIVGNYPDSVRLV